MSFARRFAPFLHHYHHPHFLLSFPWTAPSIARLKSSISLSSMTRTILQPTAPSVVSERRDSNYSTPATSISTPIPSDKPTNHTPPFSSSEYRWRFLPAPLSSSNGVERKEVSMWWRPIDPMANFILHWEKRFFGHGDMFLSTTLSSSSSSFNISPDHLREALRRLRFSHPTIAVRLAKRAEVGITDRVSVPSVVGNRVDLQVALVYDLLLTDHAVDQWIDQILVLHNDSEDGGFENFVQQETKNGIPARDGLKVHYWPSTGRLTFEQSHSVSEGIGLILTLNTFLSTLASTLSSSPSPTPQRREFVWGEEVVRLEPALQDAIAHPPESWQVTKKELKQVRKINAERMNGKSTPPNIIDKVAGKVVTATIANAISGNGFRRKVVNKPLVGICRSVAEKGSMLPLGLLPQTGKEYRGEISHTGVLTQTLSAEQTQKLLLVLKERGLTLAPFMEAVAHMSTTWIRKHRGLTPKDKWDNPQRILGSFSNAISKRDTLLPQYKGYLGLCMSGFPTTIPVSLATWSHSKPHSSELDPMPDITTTDLTQLFTIAETLKSQYKQGRNIPDWLKSDKALMMETMATEYLFLRDPAHYPSNPWLSSVGKVDGILSPTHTLADDEEGKQGVLEVKNVQLVGRVGIRQPILHVYSFRGETKLQLSFAEWYYPRDIGEKGGRRKNVLEYWLEVYRSLIDSVTS